VRFRDFRLVDSRPGPGTDVPGGPCVHRVWWRIPLRSSRASPHPVSLALATSILEITWFVFRRKRASRPAMDLSLRRILPGRRPRRFRPVADVCRLRRRLWWRRRHSSNGWAFRQLQSFVEYKAKAAGIAVEYVAPADASQTCSKKPSTLVEGCLQAFCQTIREMCQARLVRHRQLGGAGGGGVETGSLSTKAGDAGSSMFPSHLRLTGLPLNLPRLKPEDSGSCYAAACAAVSRTQFRAGSCSPPAGA